MNFGQSRYIAGCYCRLSRDDEHDGMSVSIETQRKVLEDYCRSHGYEIHNFYCDDGYSGTTYDRPSFKRMMDDMHNGMINMVVVKDLSRLGRNYIETGRLIEEVFPESGVRFIAVGDDVDTDRENMDLDLMLPMKNIFNQYYPADVSRKTRQAFKTKALHGEFIGTFAPYGYRKSAADKHVLEPDEVTAPIVVEIFEMAAYKGYGYNKIANVLRLRKVLTPTAYRMKLEGVRYDKDPYDWNLVSIRKILENRVYLGHTINGKKKKVSFKSKRVICVPEEKWVVVEHTHEPLVSDSLWSDAQKKLGSRKKANRFGEINMFAGLVKCDCCGYALTMANNRSQKKYFSCSRYKSKGKDACTIHYILFDSLSEAVLKDIQKKVRTIHRNEEGFVKKVLKSLGTTSSQKAEQAKHEMAAIEARLKELEVKFDRLYDDRLEGFISDKKFKEMALKCESEQEQLNERLAELTEQFGQQEEAVLNVERFVETIQRYAEVTELNREILNRLIDKIVVGEKIKTDKGYTQKITIYYRFLGDLTGDYLLK